ncbi:hypothetical protein T265_10116 [Opisthorchis viverrini]|uniref:Peptidase C13 family protein n=1 Tax=Opisthorchis viverrini TaxID=6198 RepID=A0A074Z3H6_OPIVI|nr:hypothetical protein T265_10116 [Opisthorchis viverrini]KER21601.1 hypothetical protein T265_10116 [Opisthorchis viverrini]
MNMLSRCSLLIAFLFCIDHVACLEAIGVHKWSSIFNNNPSKNWVVLVAGSNTWENYRHQADVYHAYRVVRANKVPAENVITFAYDDIANNPKNPFKGKVFHEYEHEDVYNGVVIDYRGKDVTRDNFVKVLKADKQLEANNKKVLKSPYNSFTDSRIDTQDRGYCPSLPGRFCSFRGPNDNVFIFFSGHGATSVIAFQEEYMYAMELNDTLAYMYSKNVQQFGAVCGGLLLWLYV